MKSDNSPRKAVTGDVSARISMTKRELEVENLRLKNILRRLVPDRFPGIFFICGEGGKKDVNGLPERIHVCPSYGCGWSQIYTRTGGPTAE